MEGETSDIKRVPLEEMSKEDIIKKYNNVLLIAKKAKQSKQETIEELKKAKENETKLTSEIDVLREIHESFTEKQKQYAEIESSTKIIQEKNSELKTLLDKAKNDLAMKVKACKNMEDKLLQEQEKYSTLEVKYLETQETVNHLKEDYTRLNIQKKIFEEKVLMYEKENNKKTEHSNNKSIDIFKENESLKKSLSEKNSECSEVLKNFQEIQEKFKNVPENWSDIIDENKKLKETLKLTEICKESLVEEVENMKKKMESTNGKSGEYAQLSECLLAEEQENLKLMEEIDELKQINESIVKELDQKESLLVWEKKAYNEKLEECNEQYEKKINLLEDQLEKERQNNAREVENRYDSYNKTISMLENHIKSQEEKLCALGKEKENLENLLENEKLNLKVEMEKNSETNFIQTQLKGKIEEIKDILNREKVLLAENNELKKLNNDLGININAKMKEYENQLLIEKEKFEKLQQEKENMESLLADQNIKIAENEKHKKKMVNFAEEMKKKIKDDEEELKKEREKFEILNSELGKARRKLNDKTADIERERKDWIQLKKEMESELEDHSKLKKQNADLKKQIAVLETQREDIVRKNADDENKKIGEFIMEKENLLRKISELENQKAEMESEKIESIKLNQDFLEEEKEKLLNDQKLILQEENNKKFDFEKNFVKQEEKVAEEQIISTLKEENLFLRNEIQQMKCGYDESVNLVRRKLEELLASFTKIKNLRNNFNKDFKTKLKTFQIQQSDMRHNIEKVVLKYVGQLHNGNTELLSEMNDMNQVLKERGETISKLEQLTETQRMELEEAISKISNQSSKLVEKNKKLEEIEEEMCKAKLEVENKHRAMRDMEEEMWRMRNNDGQCEALSSSNLSKADEAARLTELEESFEERYTRLKIVTVKLKKKVTDLQKQVETERNNLLTTENEYQSKITTFHNQIKSLRNIQTDYDNLQDVLDEERKQNSSLKKNLELSQQDFIACNKQLEDAKKEKEKFKSDRTSFEKVKKELSAHICELKQTIEKQRKDTVHLEKQMEDIKSQLSIKERHLEEEKEKHKMAILLLEEQKLDSRKHSVLELEMAAYEKTAEDLKKRLDDTKKQMEELNSQLENERQEKATLKDEMIKLKSNVSDEQIKSDAYNSQLMQLSDELEVRKNEVEKKINIVKGLEKNIEEKNVRIENLSLQLEAVTKEKFKNDEEFRSSEEKFCRQIRLLDEKVSSLQEVLGQKEIELEELKKEYQAYKLRAQSVLRQSQKEINPSKQQNALEELEQLKSTSDSLKARLHDSSTKIQKLMEENESLQAEKKILFGRVQELNSVIGELRNENNVLKEVKQKESEEYAETLRIQKLQSETLAQCFRREMEDLEAKHTSEIGKLNRELEETRKNNQKLFKPDMRIAEARKIASDFIPVKSEKDVLDVMLLEREECEGSESIDSASPQMVAHSNIVPLEQLLNQSELSDAKKTVQDAAQLRNKLEKCENRIKHLTVLLAEAESDSARLNQLNEVLKEEIKRLLRSLEREKHAQNSEYLKNVIMKFISLQNVDERLRLVPVLNTILKLSPEEENTLTNCAKGIFESVNRGWGINLNIWPSG